MTEPKDLICEIRLTAADRLRLEIDGLLVDGRCDLPPSLEEAIYRAPDPRRAGSRLFDALLPEGEPSLEAYRKITSELRRMGTRQCVRLNVAPEAPDYLHALPWELLYDPRRRLGLGRCQEVSFLRVVDSDRPPPAPIEGILRILLAVPSPSDVLQHNLPSLDRRLVERSLMASLRRLQDLVAFEILEPPVTAERLGARLADGTFHVLHLPAHGRKLPHEPRARVLLEDDSRRGVWTDADAWVRLLSGDPDLHLVTLTACHDGIETRADPFYGLGPALAGPGVPAVVTTRRALTVSQASKMSAHLYRGLALTGRIDEAINEARERLYLSRPERFTWSVPAAFLAGGEPFLWHSEESRRRRVEEDTQSLEMAQFRLEQQRREQIAAFAEEPPPPEPKSPATWGWAALIVAVLAVGLGLAGSRGSGPLSPWLSPETGPATALEGDRRPRQSVDPEATRRALPRYASACDAGQALACARLATIYELGRGVQKDLAVAETYYHRACSGGDPASCYHLGHLLESPSKSPSGAHEPREVRDLYERSCAGGEPRACRRLTVLRAQDDVPEDLLAAAETDVPFDPAPDAPGDLAEAAAAGPPGAGPAESPADLGSGDPADSGSPTDATETRPAPKAYVDGVYGEAPAAPTVAAAPRSTDGEMWIYELGGTATVGTAVGRARGNVYRIFEPARLLAWDVWLDFIEPQDLTFSVHVADADLGSYTQVFQRNLTVEGRGADWYSSGELELPLEAGRYYLVAVSWNGEATYTFSDGGPRRTFFGELTHGHVDLDPILPEVESEVADLAAYRQRLITAHGVRIDGESAKDLADPPMDALMGDLEPAADLPADDGPMIEAGSSGFTATSSEAEGAYRGNVVRIDRPSRLRGLGIWLDPAAPPTLTASIYRTTYARDGFEQVHRESWTPSELGARWYRSPDFDLPLESGAYYAVVFEWDQAAAYRFGVGGIQETPVGSLVQGLSGEGPAPTGALAVPPDDRAFYHQRWYLFDTNQSSRSVETSFTEETSGFPSTEDPSLR